MAPGHLIDRYELELLLQSGGCGSVWRAHHVHTRRPVAIKLLDAARAQHPAALARFTREAQLVADIDSPHVVQVLDWGELDGGEAYLVMELLRGHDLRRELSVRHKLPLAEALDIARQMIAGLAAAHARRIVHRDLKPSNVFLVEDGVHRRVKLVDFGIGKRLVSRVDVHTTAMDVSLGTPGYMAPEQVRAIDADERSDIYAAAVVLYELIAGVRPWRPSLRRRSPRTCWCPSTSPTRSRARSRRAAPIAGRRSKRSAARSTRRRPRRRCACPCPRPPRP
jgi:serine/threonine-protein kinase